jgi:pyruvate formate lyase activating enzyme
MEVKAKYYREIGDKRVECTLCPHFCKISEGKTGICRLRKNIGGVLYEIGYGNTISISMDPIEKKPLYHFYPGENILSIGPNGCNLSCDFCQNWEISQRPAPTQEFSPEEIYEVARRNGSIGIAYTYTEPLIWFNYIKDTAEVLHTNDMVNVLVTNGYINKEPLIELLPLIDAMNVDLKSMKDEFYIERCGGRLEPVLNTLKIAKDKTHIEITNLIITGVNDTDKDIENMAKWIADNMGTDTVLHLSRFFPRYKSDEPPTPVDVLKRAMDISKKYLNYIYLGNVSSEGPSHTDCADCGNTLVKRWGYTIQADGVNKGKCVKCGAKVPFIVKKSN